MGTEGGSPGGVVGALRNISARVRRTSTGYTLPDSVYSAIPFEAAEVDNGGFFSLGAATKLTAPRNGIYIVTGYLAHTYNGLGSRRASLIGKNGATGAGVDVAFNEVQMELAAAGVGTFYTPVGIFKLAAGDYVELMGYQDSGAPAAVFDYPWFSISLLDIY
jgi:hypothetical protein